MSSPTIITSSAHFTTLISTNTYVVVDFHATWCGPCKAIAPTFSSLASTHTSPSRLAFAKVDVDAQPAIAREYSVRAMPTFLIFKNRTVIDTIQGANPSALTAAVTKAANDANKGSAASSTAFQSKGHVLGGDGVKSRVQAKGWGEWVKDAVAGGAGARQGVQTRSVGGSAGRSLGRNGVGFVDLAVRFFGLYFTSLFALDAFKAAEESPFRGR